MPTPRAGLVPWRGQVSAFTSSLPAVKPLVVYPNPGREAQRVQWESAYWGEIILELTDLNGRVLKSVRTSKAEDNWLENWELASVPPGAYLLRIQTKGESFVKRVILE